MIIGTLFLSTADVSFSEELGVSSPSDRVILDEVRSLVLYRGTSLIRNHPS